jgi:nucleotide-binding universal stress UspA family protein
MGTNEPDRPTILAGIDGSPSSLAALEWAAQQAELTGSDLVVMAAWQVPGTYAAAAVTDEYDPAAEMQTVLDHSLHSIQDRHRTLRTTGQVIDGYPGPALVDASRDADLLVVGSRGHRAFTGFLLGSVGMHCVTHAHCPVLVYRSDRDKPVTAAISTQSTVTHG